MTKKTLPILLLLALLTGFALYLSSRSKPPLPVREEPAASAPASADNHPPRNTPPAAPDPTPAASPDAATDSSAVSASPTTAGVATPGVQALPAPETAAVPPATLLENMRTAVRNYGQRFGGNPVGNNPEITKALNGGNPKQVQFLNPEAGLRVNGNGELIDSWGTPFFFHQLSGTEMEIRSAGPDRKMWTADDLVIR